MMTENMRFLCILLAHTVKYLIAMATETKQCPYIEFTIY